MGLSFFRSGGKVDALPLRPCVGIVLFNGDGKVWVGRRRPKWAREHGDLVDGHIWQPPQGGIDKGEHARDAAFRELREETGITNVVLVAELPKWLSFELPDQLMGVALKGRFAGQKMRWFAMQFLGEESEIDIARKERTKAEFDDWRWVDLAELPKLGLSFKRPVYEAVAREFRPHARTGNRSAGHGGGSSARA